MFKLLVISLQFFLVTSQECRMICEEPNLPTTSLIMGKAGPRGEVGPPGEIGTRGLQGTKGENGDTGLRGTKGENGDTGPQGTKGEIGDTGLRGAKGENGDTGPQGTKGENGHCVCDMTDFEDKITAIQSIVGSIEIKSLLKN